MFLTYRRHVRKRNNVSTEFELVSTVLIKSFASALPHNLRILSTVSLVERSSMNSSVGTRPITATWVVWFFCIRFIQILAECSVICQLLEHIQFISIGKMSAYKPKGNYNQEWILLWKQDTKGQANKITHLHYHVPHSLEPMRSWLCQGQIIEIDTYRNRQVVLAQEKDCLALLVESRGRWMITSWCHGISATWHKLILRMTKMGEDAECIFFSQ